MRARTRYFVITAFLVLAVGLGTGLVAHYAGLETPFLSQSRPDEFQLIPRNAALVAHINVRGVMASEVRQRLKAFFPQSADGQSMFGGRTGIVLERDVERVTLSLAPVAGAMPDKANAMAPLAVATGAFDAVHIQRLMEGHGARADEYDGVRLMVSAPDLRGGRFSVAFLTAGQVVLGEDSLVRAAVDRRKDGGENVTGNGEMMALVRTFADRDAWVVGRLDALTAQAPLTVMASDLPALTWLAAGVHLNGGLRGTVQVEAADQEAADNVRQVIQGLVAMGRLHAASQPGVKALLDSLILGGSERTVSLSFNAPLQLLDALPPPPLSPRR